MTAASETLVHEHDFLRVERITIFVRHRCEPELVGVHQTIANQLELVEPVLAREAVPAGRHGMGVAVVLETLHRGALSQHWMCPLRIPVMSE